MGCISCSSDSSGNITFPYGKKNLIFLLLLQMHQDVWDGLQLQEGWVVGLGEGRRSPAAFLVYFFRRVKHIKINKR